LFLQKLPELSAADLVKLQVEQIEKDKKDLSTKLSGVSKRIDHLERAFRREEIPLVKQDYEQQQTRDRVAHEQAQVSRAETLRNQHAANLAIKASLVRIMGDYHSFKTKTEAESRKAYEQEEQKLKEQLEEAKAERRREVLAQREQEKKDRIRREEEQAERAAFEAGELYLLQSLGKPVAELFRPL